MERKADFPDESVHWQAGASKAGDKDVQRMADVSTGLCI
jgi:hypothetical protein